MLESLDIRIKSLDEKFKLLMDETNKRNEQRFESQQKAVADAMASADKAVTKAEIAAEKRFESVNEFRKTLSDQTASFLTRSEYSVQYQALHEKIDMFSSKLNSIDKLVGEIKERGAAGNDYLGRLISIIAILISAGTLIFLLFRHV